jgi:hypothetical protein
MYWKQESTDKFSNAMTAAKFEGMGGRWWKRWQQQTKEHEFINIRLRKIKNMGNKPLQNLNVPKQGMSKKNPSELENEYSFAMNANIENSSGFFQFI